MTRNQKIAFTIGVLFTAVSSSTTSAKDYLQGQGQVIVRQISLDPSFNVVPAVPASVDVTPAGFGGALTFTCVQVGPEPAFQSTLLAIPSSGGSVSWLPSGAEIAPGVFQGVPTASSGQLALVNAPFGVYATPWVTADIFVKSDPDGSIVHIHALLWFRKAGECNAFLVLTTQ